MALRSGHDFLTDNPRGVTTCYQSTYARVQEFIEHAEPDGLVVTLEAMTYYVSKVFWLLAAPTSALVLISAIAALWAVLGGSKCAAWLAAAATCVLVIGAFTPIGIALTVPLETRFAL